MPLIVAGQHRKKRFRHARIAVAFFLSMFISVPLYAFDFSQWSAILRNNTRPSNYAGIEYSGLDYAAIRNSGEFDKLLGSLELFSPEELHGREEKLAFWINVYNIFAVKLVRDHFPITSIRNVGSIFSPVWTMPVGKVGGQMYTLNDIEHEILRPMNEPGIHFAIVCASVSCPDLRSEAYTASALRDQLRSQAKRFLESKGKGMWVEREKKMVHLSMIFEWYKKDFAESGGVIGFLNGEGGGSWNIPQGYAIKYLPYNWDLNTAR